MSPLRFPSRIALSALFLAGAARAAESQDFEKTVKPFFQEHCFKCHGEKKQKGDLRLDTMRLDFTAPSAVMHWADIMDRMNSAEMPPEDEKQPNPEEVAKIAEWINSQLSEADAAQKAGLGEKVSFRRLTREEYRNTIRDLLGVNYDAADPAGLPEDPDWQGFQRIGSVLTISPAHVEKYLSAAETVLNEAVALGPEPKRDVTHWDPFLLRAGCGWRQPEKHLVARGIAEKVRVDITPNNNAYGIAGGNELLTIKTTGEYIVRVKLSALRPAGGAPPRLSIYAADLGRTLFESDVEAPEDQPITVEFRTHLPAGVHPIRIFNAVHGPSATDHANQPGFTHCYTDLRRRQPWQIKLTDEDYRPRVPFILLDSVDWEGPVNESWPPVAHQRIFFGGDGAVKDLAYARQILTRFAERAYRRPVEPAEVEPLVGIVDEGLKLGDTFESSVRTALLAVLCSKNFVYLVEGNLDAPSPKLNDWELASRLSYFLWSTMPDERLLDLARKGKLHEPEVLRAEVRRMMKDKRIGGFADSFPRQWLQLRRVGMFPPDQKLYPDYDDYLEKSMVTETTEFFREVMSHNLGLREFIDSDWTMLNRRLAVHYGIGGVEGEQFQRVALKPDDHRGGLLTQASILSLTSDGTRHRPVHRGKWILESIIGRPPPPPPANVPAIKTSAPNQPKASLRAKLEAHKSDANCAACHRKIDPLGLAFDNYDAIGHWRTEEAVSDGAGANPRIDPSGVLPDGREFADAAALKKLMLADIDKLAAAFTEKLATYALRRGMTFGDRAELKHIAEQAKANDYPLASLIEYLTTSELFQKR
jgi:mono/diheme cytochrome c family protein